ncbi:MAG: glutamate-1-semialdehyde 2,1-aminomutase [Deltaproteobacteria bacterium]|nr:glutamate-1-semialdehyde 2,1-aminomutase [Deltaproteobacteria bacterium]
MSDPVSRELFARASRVIPGGVNSPVRAFRAVGGEPVFIARARGATLTGADGRDYIDYVGSWGPMIVGHAHPEVVAEIQRVAEAGTSYGAPTEREIELAEQIVAAYPSMELVRLTSSGTEATMGALRVARGFTGRDLVVKLEGCYHGHADYLLVKAGSGLATFGTPDSAGVPAAIAGTCAALPYNDADAVAAFLDARGDEVAAIILEPVVGNMGLVPPAPGYLARLRELCDRSGALLVIDEVMTGFRVAYGGAQSLYGVRPDLTCLGKIIGGGLPVGAYGGRRDVMSKVAPLGPVYQAGTLSGNPLACAAGLKTLEILRRPGTYEKLEQSSARLAAGLAQAAREADRSVVVQRVGSMLTPFFTDAPAVRNWGGADRCDRAAFGRWHAAMLREGIYWPPSQFEAAFVSLAHDDDAIGSTIAAARVAFRAV